MTKYQMATVPKKGFAFCRYTIAILLWITVILVFFNIKWIIFIPFIIMLLSGILTVRRAPLIMLYKALFDREGKGETDVLNVSSIRFSHFVGSFFCIIIILFLYVVKIDIVAYVFLGILTILQTIAAFGYCSAQKLYECLVLGKNCCNLGKKIKGGSCSVR
ncbi:MAG: DUF4395 family protein [Bacilli bacterium]|nr:DUF4395 family protein [Bacilli bacterium]MBQ7241010.1 DUF4395 family protein [Bacilli bacterium]